jgi:ring-1,2-phenylacetyl-CoA epoxidase subunit PaaC
LLREVAGDSVEADPEDRASFTNASFLDEPFESWCDFVAANFLFDTAITVLLEAAQTSSMNDLSQRAKRILEEEPLHWLHGEGWTRKLPSKGPAVREQLAQAMDHVAPESMAWFDVADPTLVDDRTLSQNPETLRERYRSRVTV